MQLFIGLPIVSTMRSLLEARPEAYLQRKAEDLLARPKTVMQVLHDLCIANLNQLQTLLMSAYDLVEPFECAGRPVVKKEWCWRVAQMCRL